MIQAEITSVVKDRIVKTGEGFLDVTVDFAEGEGKKRTVLDTRKYGYPLGTTTEEIKEDLAKAVATFEQDRQQAETQKEEDATNEQANQVIQDLAGQKVDKTFKPKKATKK